MTQLEKREDNRTELVEKAWELYQKGMSYTAIGKEIGRHRNTVSEYVKEYADTLDRNTLDFQRRVSVAQLRKVIEHAWTMLETGEIKDSSLTRPQLLHQIIQAVKEINKISGLHISQVHVEQYHHVSAADRIRAIEAEMQADGFNNIEAWLNWKDWQADIVDAEVIDDG